MIRINLRARLALCVVTLCVSSGVFAADAPTRKYAVLSLVGDEITEPHQHGRQAVEIGGRVPTDAPQRPGDPSRSVADAGLIARELGWRARWDLTDAVHSAWTAGIPVAARRPLRRRPLQPAAAS